MNLKSLPGLVLLLMTSVSFSQDLVINVSLKQPKMLVIDAGEDISVEDPENIIIGEDITVTGGTSEYSYSWADGSGNTYNSRTVSVSSFGSYYLTVTDANNCSAKDTLQVLNNVFTDPGIDRTSAILFPNPSSGTINIPLAGFTGELQIRVLSASGSLVFKKDISVFQSGLYHEFELGNLAKGLYHIILENDSSREFYKLILE
jgi:hypothetical protein